MHEDSPLYVFECLDCKETFKGSESWATVKCPKCGGGHLKRKFIVE